MQRRINIQAGAKNVLMITKEKNGSHLGTGGNKTVQNTQKGECGIGVLYGIT
jgi:hypothetical protein